MGNGNTPENDCIREFDQKGLSLTLFLYLFICLFLSFSLCHVFNILSLSLRLLCAGMKSGEEGEECVVGGLSCLDIRECRDR